MLRRRSLASIHGMTPLLDVRNLRVTYHSRAVDRWQALAHITFQLQAGETLGVLGESGSGKSTLAVALLRFLPANAQVHGEVFFEGQELVRAPSRGLQSIRGRRVAAVFQEPLLGLHPMLRISEQVSDVLSAHDSLSRKERRDKTLQLLSKVFPADSERIARSYPHQLSGGQRQRVLIAQAIACGPSLIIAVEPTASLDPTTQQEILALFRGLRQQLKLSMILITHNPALLAGFADRILILYSGHIVEIGPTERVLTAPQHPYTQALLRCASALTGSHGENRKQRLPVVPGDSPNMLTLPPGCRFEPRCPDRFDLCTKRAPELIATSADHGVSCFKYGG
jgi:oligopeptide/dipeptide ABC transporter ATP-binding protein